MIRTVGLALAAALAITTSAHAQEFPQKPIRIIVPWGVGTPPDLVARVVGAKASQTLGQPILVENRPGAGGTVGLMEFLKQPADGYTLVTLGNSGALTPVLYPNLPVDLRRDLAPVVQLESFDNVLVVANGSPMKTPQDLAAAMRARPNALSFGSGGNATPAHMSGELFKQLTGLSAQHVPYNVFPQAIGDVIAARLDFMFLATPAAVPQVRGGKMRALAVTGAKRVPGLEDVPTMREAGFPSFVISSWDAVFAPAGTPPAVISRLNAEFVRALNQPDVKDALAKMSVEGIGGTPAELGAKLSETIDSYGKVARTAGLRAD